MIALLNRKIIKKKIMMNQDKKETIYSVILFGMPMILVLVFLIFGTNPTKNVAQVKPGIDKVENPVQISDSSFFNLGLTAKAVVVKDLNTGKIIFQKNAGNALPIASITKIMTAVVATEHIESGSSTVSIVPESARTGDGEYLENGSRFKFKKLRDYMLVSSSNDGAAAIAIATQRIDRTNSFVDKMNFKAKEIGMNQTRFLNETGLDENNQTAGAFGSADDVAKLMEYTLVNHPDILEATRESVFYITSETGQYYTATNTNQTSDKFPSLIGSKTGFTDISGGNLVVAVDPSLNRPIIIVILGSTLEGRFSDAEKIAGAVSNYFSSVEQNVTL